MNNVDNNRRGFWGIDKWIHLLALPIILWTLSGVYRQANAQQLRNERSRL